MQVLFRVRSEASGSSELIMESLLYEVCQSRQVNEHVEAFELNAKADFVHLVASIQPKYAVSEFLGHLSRNLALRRANETNGSTRRYW